MGGCASTCVVWLVAMGAARAVGDSAPAAAGPAESVTAAAAAWRAEPRDDVAVELESIRARRGVPALAAAAARGDRLLALGVAGTRGHRSKDRVQPDDRFHLGSCTKSMTALLCARLVEQGRLRWDTTLAEALGDRARGLDAGFQAVTLEQLLCHRAGLAEDRMPNPLQFAKIWTLAGPLARQRIEYLDMILAQPPASAPGSTFAYSNGGIVAAGAMAECATGEPYEELMQRLVFGPLGITSAGFGPPGMDGAPQPRGHRKLVWYVEDKPAPAADNPAVFSPAGRAHMSIGDFARYGAFILRTARGSDELIRPETFARMRSDPYGQGYSFGWGVPELQWAGGRVLAHDGSNTRWYAVIVVAPQRDLAIVAATNVGDAAGEEACKDAVKALRERCLKLPRP